MEMDEQGGIDAEDGNHQAASTTEFWRDRLAKLIENQPLAVHREPQPLREALKALLYRLRHSGEDAEWQGYHGFFHAGMTTAADELESALSCSESADQK